MYFPADGINIPRIKHCFEIACTVVHYTSESHSLMRKNSDIIYTDYFILFKDLLLKIWYRIPGHSRIFPHEGRGVISRGRNINALPEKTGILRNYKSCYFAERTVIQRCRSR
jgi:hypothetical protein